VTNADIGEAPVFVNSNSTISLDFSVGNQIGINRTTTGCDDTKCTVTNSNVTGNTGTALDPNTKYDVKLVHVPSNAMLVDTVIEVR
jgi:hypothetical protein